VLRGPTLVGKVGAAEQAIQPGQVHGEVPVAGFGLGAWCQWWRRGVTRTGSQGRQPETDVGVNETACKDTKAR
jgi:hypothetical protein